MSMKNQLTRQIAEFVVNTSFTDVPREVIETSKNHILDGLGVILAGARQEVSSIVQTYLREIGGREEASILGTSLPAPMEAAALANGTAGHALDYDDTQLAIKPDRVTGLLTHPTIPVLAAALAVAEYVQATGREFLVAFNIGVEIECKIAEAIHPRHYLQGFHSTGTIGGFGAVAAAGKLLDLSIGEMLRAFGLVGSMGAGLRANFGTMTKPFHAGRAAQNGVLAARLVKAGFVSTKEVLDSDWGFFQVTAGGCDGDLIRDQLGVPYNMVFPGISIKPYPCGSLGHPTMDATLELRQKHRIEPEAIESIDVTVSSHVLNALIYQQPSTELEAKFSLPFGITLIAVKGKAGVHEYTQQVVEDPELREFMERIRCSVDAEIDAKGYDRMHGRVTIHLKDGRSLTRVTELARGHPAKPLSRKELSTKFIECARLAIPPDNAEKAIELVYEDLEELSNVSRLASLLSNRANNDA